MEAKHELFFPYQRGAMFALTSCARVITTYLPGLVPAKTGSGSDGNIGELARQVYSPFVINYRERGLGVQYTVYITLLPAPPFAWLHPAGYAILN